MEEHGHNWEYQERGGLRVARVLCEFVEHELLAGLESLRAPQFWQCLEDLVIELGPANREHLRRRDKLQQALDQYLESPKPRKKPRAFLEEIGYLQKPGGEFRIGDGTAVDAEVVLAGPQLVVPVNNARYALNAANARWGSLYDALYGSDVIARDGKLAPGKTYNPLRGAQVVAEVAAFLDRVVPLRKGSHARATAYTRDGKSGALCIELEDGSRTGLARAGQWRGFRENEAGEIRTLLFENRGLHIELSFDRTHPVGQDHAAGLCDVELEAALTAIQDCEDSVAAVDAEDKVLVYGNWLGLMRGDLQTLLSKNGKVLVRKLTNDREYKTPAGQRFRLPGRSLLFVRNVGPHMYTDAVLDARDNSEIPEAFLDALVTVAAALYDLRDKTLHGNSRARKVYVVKPKLHGPDEAALVNTLFERVEAALDLAPGTVRVGLMDEERRTSVNLKECVRALRKRIVFINTGFLDRTGDEIHSNFRAGPVLAGADLKQAGYLQAYEQNNVAVGLAAGFHGQAQIGKGMWAEPDHMRAMLATKIAHAKSGANCAWVPSPTAAVLHAVHYHQVDIEKIRKTLQKDAANKNKREQWLAQLLTPPITTTDKLTPAVIQKDLENNLQRILGYVVRWIDQGVGCSKVPDRSDVNLMEDRATLRIASQHLANWLWHGVITESQLRKTARAMAKIVDRQNKNDAKYTPMSHYPQNNLAFQAALELVLRGHASANGFTESILHKARRARKRLP